MEKILLAVGHRQLEEFLDKQLRKEFLFVGTTIYREGIIRSIGQNKPDIVIIRETLQGNENIMSILYEIRTKFPKIRIVFIAGKREPGDALLATLVNYGIYDILQGETIPSQQIVSLVRKPNEYTDVSHFQPAPILDENTNEVLFKAPETVIRDKEVIKEVFVDTGEGDNSQKALITIGKVMPETKEPVLKEKPEKEKVVKEKPAKEKPAKENPVPKKPKAETIPAPIKEEKSDKPDKPSILDTILSMNRQSYQENQMPMTKQKIITFLGTKNGVGNTSVALNTAVSLAKKGSRVLFLEFNDTTPSVSYWYELGFIDDGIDSSLEALKTQDFEKIEEAIIRTTDLQDTESTFQSSYKKFPKSLDFMFFSKKHISREINESEEPLDLNLSKELFLYLLFQAEYDFVILDVPPDIHHKATMNAIMYSHKVVMTMTQDVSSIGYGAFKLNEWLKKGIQMQKRLHFVVNQFEKSKLTMKEIEDWLETKQITAIPVANKEFINANYIGLPVLLDGKQPIVKPAFEKLVKEITE